MRHGADPTGTVDSYAAAIAAHTALGSRGGTILFPAGKYKFSSRPVFTKSVKLKGAGIGTSTALASTVLRFDSGIAGPKVTGYGSSVEDMWIEGTTGGAGTDDGLAIRCQHASVTNVISTGFGRDGFSIDSDDGSVNANLPTFVNTLALSNYRHGYYTNGSDANAGCFVHPHSFQNGGYGFYDAASGNNYFSPLDDGSTLGSFYNAGLGSTWIGPYSENSATFTIALGSSHGYVRFGAYGAPTIVNNAVAGGAWTVEKNSGVRLGRVSFRNYDPAQTHEYGFDVGVYAAGAMSLVDVTNAATLLNIDSTNTRIQANIALETATGIALNIGGALNHDGSTVGLFGHAPSAQPAAYTVTNPTTDRALNVTADTLAQVAQVLGTLIADLQTMGVIG